MAVKTSQFLVGVFMTSLICGCSDNNADISKPNSRIEQRGCNLSTASKKYDDLHDDAILISVNGAYCLSKKEFDRWIELRQMAVKGQLSYDASVTSEQSAAFEQMDLVKKKMIQNVTNDYQREAVLKEYANLKGIIPDSNQIERCKKGFRRTMRSKEANWEKFLGGFSSDLQSVISNRVESESIMLAVHENFTQENPVEINENEFEKVYSAYLAYNTACSVTNSLIWAKATNIWTRVKAGEDFKELAIQFDEDETRSEDGEWGIFKITDFTDEPEIWRLVNNFKIGWVSPPLEADNGLMIMKIDAIEEDGKDTSALDYAPSPDAELTISRIFLHLPMFIEEISKEDFRQEFQVAQKSHIYEQFVASLIKNAKIKYPSGTLIFDPTSEESDMMFPSSTP